MIISLFRWFLKSIILPFCWSNVVINLSGVSSTGVMQIWFQWVKVVFACGMRWISHLSSDVSLFVEGKRPNMTLGYFLGNITGSHLLNCLASHGANWGGCGIRSGFCTTPCGGIPATSSCETKQPGISHEELKGNVRDKDAAPSLSLDVEKLRVDR